MQNGLWWRIWVKISRVIKSWGYWLAGDKNEPFGVWKIICVLIWWLVIQAYTYTKCQQAGHLIFAYFTECELYFNTIELVQEKQSAYGGEGMKVECSLISHIQSICKSEWFYCQNIFWIQPLLSIFTTFLLVQSNDTSQLEYSSLPNYLSASTPAPFPSILSWYRGQS